MDKFTKIINETRSLYLNDKRPWVIGYSGGKDSTCLTQLVYNMLKNLPPNKRDKEITILSSNTLVESPFILDRMNNSYEKIKDQVKKDNLPIKIALLKPELNDTFWVNLIGRGYPSPNKWFRWCTDRLKIKPMNKFIKNEVAKNGEVIILLGARKSESSSRAQTLNKYKIKNSKLKRNETVPNAFIYTPIEDFEFTDVWEYLLENESPWGDDNHELARLYKRVNGECPLVIDSTTPACGGSRFGCWTCTVVSRDRAIEGLIEDGEKWLQPLLDFRNWIKDIRDDPSMREPLRKGEKDKKLVLEFFGKEFKPMEKKGHKVLGPFTFEARHEILIKLLKIQKDIRDKDVALITPEEIDAIVNIWIYEGDDVSEILKILNNEDQYLQAKDDLYYYDVLDKISKKHDIPSDLIERLLVAEKDFSKLSRRMGIYNKLEKILESYTTEKIKSRL